MFKDDDSLGLRTQRVRGSLVSSPGGSLTAWDWETSGLMSSKDHLNLWFFHVTQKILGTRFIALIWTSTIISQPQKSIPFLYGPFSYWDTEIWGMVMLGAWSLRHNEWRLKKISLWNWHIKTSCHQHSFNKHFGGGGCYDVQNSRHCARYSG